MKKKDRNFNHKVLLMGRQSSGKTSMRSIIFANYLPTATEKLVSTIDVDSENLSFLGGLNLNLWDCGGQMSFMEEYLERQKDRIFCHVAVMIYVFDMNGFYNDKQCELETDISYYRRCVEALMQNSPEAKVFCFLHKMDLIPKKEREIKYEEQKEIISKLTKVRAKFFATSIWDESLFISWSAMIHDLIPNMNRIEKSLLKFCKVLSAYEIVLFERNSFLIIARSSNDQNKLTNFEKISNIVKQFKLSCYKANTRFNRMTIKNNDFFVNIQKFTDHSFIMVVLKTNENEKNCVTEATIELNIKSAKKFFEKLFDTKGEIIL